jgi:hypothetical protein
MKPIVVSAAYAERAPSALPSVSAAPPCNRCRLEILPKSIGCSLWRIDRRRFRGFAGPAEPGASIAMFVPEPVLCSWTRNRLIQLDLYVSLDGLKVKRYLLKSKF